MSDRLVYTIYAIGILVAYLAILWIGLHMPIQAAPVQKPVATQVTATPTPEFTCICTCK